MDEDGRERLGRLGIRLDGVRFAYPGGEPVLDGLDLDIPAGRSTAIVGVNGAGKTTLVTLLARMHDPTGGTIIVDGVPLRDLDAARWQRRFAAVFQDFNRYPLPLGENVALGAVEHAGDEDGRARAEAAFYDRFLDLTRGLTSIVISHRFSTVRRADRICVLDGGRLAEQGGHDELMALGGTYAEMFRLQAARFRDEEDDA